MTFEPDACSHLVDNDLEGALKALEVDMEDPYADYAVVKRTWIPQMHRRSLPQYMEESPDPPTFRPKDPRDALEFLQQYENDYPGQNSYRNDRPMPQEPTYLTTDDLVQMYPIIKFLNDLHLTPGEIRQFLSPKNYEKLSEVLARFDQRLEEEDDSQKLLNLRLADEDEFETNYPDERFTLKYNTPDNFRAGWESKDSLSFKGLENEIPESRVYFDEDDEQEQNENGDYGSGNFLAPEEIVGERKMNYNNYNVPTEREIFRELEKETGRKSGMNKPHPGVYTEGGVVWSPPLERKFRQTIKDKLKAVTGIEITSVGVGDSYKAHYVTTLSMPAANSDTRTDNNNMTPYVSQRSSSKSLWDTDYNINHSGKMISDFCILAWSQTN
ncbi:hypothetical protein NQ318_010353 [Aromia moschata]|uniref:Uncharacterized protein n=1 Tax=Aromia moschata TaxID=1265417 RepID=A0AAV8Y9Y2_9CUCU|nr:hypothetical protein NQ318_010353 [Aromia moschata]